MITSIKWEKAGQCANDAGGTATKIKELIETVSFGIKFRLITKCKNKQHQLNMDTMKHLMKECDDKARKALEAISDQSEENNVEKFGNQCTMTNEEMIDRPVREVVRTIDAMESENSCLFEKIAEN